MVYDESVSTNSYKRYTTDTGNIYSCILNETIPTSNNNNRIVSIDNDGFTFGYTDVVGTLEYYAI